MCAKMHIHLAQQRLPTEISHGISFKLDVNSFPPSLLPLFWNSGKLVWNINKLKPLHGFYFFQCFILSCCYLNEGVFFLNASRRPVFSQLNMTLTFRLTVAFLFVGLTSSSLLVFYYMMSLGVGGKFCHCRVEVETTREESVCPHPVTDWLGKYLSASGYGASTQLVEGIWPKAASHLHCEGWPWRFGAAIAGHTGSLFSPTVEEARHFFFLVCFL